jgi:hypothetical protein
MSESGSSDVEPFYHETVKLDEGPQQQMANPFGQAQLPCTFETVPAGIFAGALGFVMGVGMGSGKVCPYNGTTGLQWPI